MVKLWLAFGFAAFVALVSLLAGFLAEARITVVLTRASLAFVVAAVIGFGIQLFIDHYGIQRFLPGYDTSGEKESSEELVDEEENEAAEAAEEEAEDDSAVDENEGSKREMEFSPLSPDGLRHVSSPQD